MKRTIDGIEYITEEITGKGMCYVPAPIKTDRELFIEFLIPNQFGVFKCVTGGCYDLAVQRYRSQCAILLWDNNLKSYRNYQPFKIMDSVEQAVNWLIGAGYKFRTS